MAGFNDDVSDGDDTVTVTLVSVDTFGFEANPSASSGVATITEDDTGPVRIQAEDFDSFAGGYKVRDGVGNAEDNALIFTRNTGEDSTATLDLDGAGVSLGLNKLEVFVFDENDGVSTVTVRIVNGGIETVIGTVTLDQDGGANATAVANKRVLTFNNVDVSEGDQLVITGVRDGGEEVLIDAVQFTPAGDGPVTEVSLGATASAVEDGDTGATTVDFAITTSPAASAGPIDVSFSVGGGSVQTQTVVLDDNGEGVLSVDVIGFNDDVSNGDDSITVTLESVDTAGFEPSGLAFEGVATVIEDDFGPVRIQAEDFDSFSGGYGVRNNVANAEENALIRTRATGEDATATLDLDGAGVLAGPNTIELFVFDENDGESTITVSIVNDGVETVIGTATLNQDGGQNSAGFLNKRTLTFDNVEITPGDQLVVTGVRDGGEEVLFDAVQFTPVATPPVASLGAPEPAIVEEGSDAGNTVLAFPVTFDKTPDGPVTVEFTISLNGGIAVASSQEVPATGGTITVTIPNDDIDNGDEVVDVVLTGIADGSVGTAVVNPAQSSAQATIEEDDALPPVISIGAPDPASVLEGGDAGNTVLDFPVTFDKTPEGPVTVNYTVSLNGGPAFALVQEIPATGGSITVLVPNDDVDNGSEVVEITLTGIQSAPEGGVTLSPEASSAQGVVTDDEAPAATVSIGAPDPASVQETGDDGSTVLDFPVSFDVEPSAPVTVEYTVTIGGVALPASAIIPATGGVISVNVPNDDEVNGDEAVEVTLTGIAVTSAAPAAIDPLAATAQATVTEDDFPTDGSALFTANAAGGSILGASTFTTNSIQITNLSANGVGIDQVVIDLSDTFIPDTVFDTGNPPAGDSTNKPFTLDGQTVGLVSGDFTVSEALPFDNGNNQLIIDFDDGAFAVGDLLSFSIDIDPITATVGAIGGAVAGQELAGGTVTVTFDDGSVATSTILPDGGTVGATAEVRAGQAEVAPTLTFGDGSTAAQLVNNASLPVIIDAGVENANGTARVFILDTAFVSPDGAGTQPNPFQGNNAQDFATVIEVQLDANGVFNGTVPITRSTTQEDIAGQDGETLGINYIAAGVVNPATDDVTLLSDPLVAQLDPDTTTVDPAAFEPTGDFDNDGQINSVDADDDGDAILDNFDDFQFDADNGVLLADGEVFSTDFNTAGSAFANGFTGYLQGTTNGGDFDEGTGAVSVANGILSVSPVSNGDTGGANNPEDDVQMGVKNSVFTV